MFDIIPKQGWVFASISFIAGIIILYNYSLNNSISIYIMFPIDMIGMIHFFLFIRSIKISEQQSLTEVAE